MAITYSPDFKTLWVDDLAPNFQGQTFEILTAGGAVMGTTVMPATDLFNPAVDGVATLQTPFDVTITVAGTAAKFRAYNSPTAYQEGSVGTNMADLNVAATVLNVDDKIRIQTWTITFP